MNDFFLSGIHANNRVLKSGNEVPFAQNERVSLRTSLAKQRSIQPSIEIHFHEITEPCLTQHGSALCARTPKLIECEIHVLLPDLLRLQRNPQIPPIGQRNLRQSLHGDTKLQ